MDLTSVEHCHASTSHGLAEMPKRKLSAGEEEQLQECLRAPRAIPSQVRLAWNVLQPKEVSFSKPAFYKKLVRDQVPESSCFEEVSLPTFRSTDSVVVLAANIPRLLAHSAEKSTAFNRALANGISCDGRLRLWMYHDEVQGGNILAPEKNKKATLFYLCCAELRPAAHLEQAWLPAAMLQHEDANKVDGGLSTALVYILRHFWRSAEPGFDLLLGGRIVQCGLDNTCSLLCDMDAQRACLNINGSAGFKCCAFCSNVLKKDSGVESDPFVELTESDRSKFISMTDEDYVAAAEKLRGLQRAKDVKGFEKTSGIKRNVHALLFDAWARKILPVSHCVACQQINCSTSALFPKP